MAVESIALPPLGRGNGGLQRHDVRGEIETAFAGVEGVRGMEVLAIVDWLMMDKLPPARLMTAVGSIAGLLPRVPGLFGPTDRSDRAPTERSGGILETPRKEGPCRTTESN
ncbi:MAG: hypothetical protein WCP98_19825 [Actinomycetes bacterium]